MVLFYSAGNANFPHFLEFEVGRRGVRLYGGHDQNRSMTADFDQTSYKSFDNYQVSMAWANKNAIIGKAHFTIVAAP